MGQIILSNCKLWVGAHDMSGKLNAIALNDAPDMLDNTAFGHTAKSRKKGLEVVTADLEGLWEAEPDKYFSNLGLFHITGTATGGSTIALIDIATDFKSKGIVIGSTVVNITDNGQTQAAGVTSITTTTNPNDTLNFAALSNSADFAGGGNSYEVIVSAGVPMTIAPEPTIGGPAYSFLSQNVEYVWGGSVGDLGKFSVKSETVGIRMVRGHILENGAAARIVTANGTAFELGAVGATKYLYGAIHVIAAATAVGDTLAVIIESDDVENFGGTPSTRITFTTVLGNGGVTYQWATPVAGEITDTWWRTAWTIVDAGADDASFTFVVFMGIV